jgi:hypothetical protein
MKAIFLVVCFLFFADNTLGRLRKLIEFVLQWKVFENKLFRSVGRIFGSGNR